MAVNEPILRRERFVYVAITPWQPGAEVIITTNGGPLIVVAHFKKSFIWNRATNQSDTPIDASYCGITEYHVDVLSLSQKASGNVYLPTWMPTIADLGTVALTSWTAIVTTSMSMWLSNLVWVWSNFLASLAVYIQPPPRRGVTSNMPVYIVNNYIVILFVCITRDRITDSNYYIIRSYCVCEIVLQFPRSS